MYCASLAIVHLLEGLWTELLWLEGLCIFMKIAEN